MKKRVLFVIDSLNSGGAEKSLVSLLSLINYEKFDVELLLFNKSGLYLPLVPKEVKILDIPEYFNNSNKIKFKIAKIKNSILIRSSIYKKKFHGAQITASNILKTLNNQIEKYDIAIAYSQGFPTYYVADKVSAVKKICWINTDYKKAGYNIEFDRKYYEKYNYMIIVSKKNKEIIESVYPEFKSKMRVIYDIISKELVKKMAVDGDGYNDNFDGIRILTIGRHVHLKGYDLAIEAAKILKEKGIKFRWYSIGEGILTNKLKRQVKNNNLDDEFIFLGTYTNPYPFIYQSDIYCQPSRFEGFGMAIAEAKILRKPIVATNFEVVYDQIDNGKNGLIVEMNAENISKAICTLINNKEVWNEKVKNIKYNFDENESSIIDFYKIVLN